MRLLDRLVPLFFLIPLAGAAANKDMVDLRRDIALLDDRVRSLQQSIDQRMHAMLDLVQQTMARVNDTRAANADDSAAWKERFTRREQEVAKPLAALDAKVSRIDSQVQGSHDALAALAARLQEMDVKLSEVDELVRIIQTPLPPPPSVSQALGGPPAGVTADSLFEAATRDRLAGRFDQASRKFNEYLKYFDNSEQAATARYHIGAIALSEGRLDAAIRDFDLVVAQHPKSARAPEALYLKGKALEKAGKRTRGLEEFQRLIAAYPKSDAARNARADLNGARR